MLLSDDCYRDLALESEEGENRVREGEPNFREAEEVYIRATANVLVLNSALLASAGREELVLSVLAHELAHYYRAHASRLLPRLNIQYIHSEKPTPGRPVPVKIEPGGEMALAFNSISFVTLASPKYEWQSFGMGLWQGVDKGISHIVERCGSAKCTPRCSVLRDFASDPEVERMRALLSAWTNAPRVREPDDAWIERYKAFEMKVKDCFSELHANDDLRNIVYSWTPPGVFNQTIWQSLLRVDEIDRKLIRDAESGIEKAKQLRLGVYSIEQEADELGVEILARNGIDPRWAAKNYLALGEWKSNRLGHKTFKECNSLARNGWKDKDGKWVVLTPMNTSEEHHDECYRAYNVAREIEAHSDRLKTQVYRNAESKSWAEARKAALEIQRTAREK